MGVLRLYPTSYKIEKNPSDSVIQDAATLTNGSDPETPASGYLVLRAKYSGSASSDDCPRIRLNFSVPSSLNGLTITKVTAKFRFCCYNMHSNSRGYVRFIRDGSSSSYESSYPISQSDVTAAQSYMNSGTTNYSTLDLNSTYLSDFISHTWKIEITSGWYNEVDYFSNCIIDIEYTQVQGSNNIEIGTSKLKKAIFNNFEISKIFKGIHLLFTKKLLPDTYQRLEYIQSTGTQYFDTGLLGKPGLKTYTELQVNNSVSDSGVLVGARDDTGQTRCYLGYRQYNSSVNFGYQEEQQSGVTPTNDVITFEYEIKSGQLVIKKNGTVILDQQHTTTFSTSYTMYAFAINYTGTASQYLSCNLYELKIWDNDVLVRDYIPCYRKSDDVIGMYDVVTKTFKVNAGTGTFIKGPEIEYDFPSAYQQVEYIESSGTQYIDTGYKIKSTTRIVIDAQSNDSGKWMYGARNAVSATDTFGVFVNSATEFWAQVGGDGTNTGGTFSGVPTNRNVIDVAGTKIKLNGTTIKTYTNKLTTGKKYLILFGLNTGGTIDNRKFNGKIYSFRIYEGNTLVKDFVPCYRKSDNAIGFYDLVNQAFLVNNGSGTFTKGPNV